jgi:hypothetical protein
VEPVSKNSPLANPTAKTAYPVVGTTNVIAYTCYADPAVAKAMTGFFGWYLKSKTVQEVPLGLLTQNGPAALPKQWQTAITESFISGNDGLNLNIQPSGTGACAGITGG